MPNDPAIPLLGIYLDKTIIQRHIQLSVHSSTVHNSQEKERCKRPSTGEWIKMMWYAYTTDYYSVIKKEGNMPFAATWMDLEIIRLSEVSQKDRDKCHVMALTRGI